MHPKVASCYFGKSDLTCIGICYFPDFSTLNQNWWLGLKLNKRETNLWNVVSISHSPLNGSLNGFLGINQVELLVIDQQCSTPLPLFRTILNCCRTPIIARKPDMAFASLYRNWRKCCTVRQLLNQSISFEEQVQLHSNCACMNYCRFVWGISWILYWKHIVALALRAIYTSF